MSFGEKLTAYRVRYGMNKKVLAERIGISSEHLRCITNGERSPSERVVNNVIEVLRLSPEEAADLREEARQRVLYDKNNRTFIGTVYSHS